MAGLSKWARSKLGKTKAARDKVHTVMHEFKEGTLHSGKSGKVVTVRQQAIAIAMNQAGLSK